MRIKVQLDHFLTEHSLSRYRLARKLRGKVSQTTVYALCRSEDVKRVDLQTLAGVMGALRELTGQPVLLSDLLVEVTEGDLPTQVATLLTAPPADWSQLNQGPAADEDDDAFWSQHRQSQRQLEKSPSE